MEEIERKFKIKSLPNLSNVLCKHIIQAYLQDNKKANSTKTEVRIRSIDNCEFYYTEKCGSGMVRKEMENRISENLFKKYLSNNVDGNIIEKRRYIYQFFPTYKIDEKITFISQVPLIAEIDIYDGALNGLMVVEVEFSNIKDAQNFVPPKWFGKDITEDKRYKNKQLAKLNKTEVGTLL